MKITTDMIVGTGLAVALLAAIFCGGSAELQTTLGSGLSSATSAGQPLKTERMIYDEGIYQPGT